MEFIEDNMVGLNESNLRIWQDGFLEHLRYRYPLNENSIVVDMGAYRGEWSDKIYDEFGCELILFEPTDNIHYAKYGRKIQACAWIENTEVRTNGAFYYTSMIHDNEVGLTKYRAVDVMEHLPEKIDLLKINVEGAEYDLLNYMIEKDIIKNIKYLQIQFHITDKFDYVDRYTKIKWKLLQTHDIMWDCEFVWISYVNIQR